MKTYFLQITTNGQTTRAPEIKAETPQSAMMQIAGLDLAYYDELISLTYVPSEDKTFEAAFGSELVMQVITAGNLNTVRISVRNVTK